MEKLSGWGGFVGIINPNVRWGSREGTQGGVRATVTKAGTHTQEGLHTPGGRGGGPYIVGIMAR